MSGCGYLCNDSSDESDPEIPGEWIAGDFHTHTYLTDGRNKQSTVAEKAFRIYGLDWFANSEHGGTSVLNPDGVVWPSGTVYKGDKAGGIDTMWRWQSIADYSWPLLFDEVTGLQREYADNILIQGVEWNVPSHEHASVAFIGQTSPKAVSEFEYCFDALDKDTSLSSSGLLKRNSTHEDSLAAVKYLQDNFKDSAWIVLNHPSKNLKYSAKDLRDYNNAGPDVFMGFEGMPGHQKNPAGRGGYKNNPGNADYEVRARTYGGADYFMAEVGGVWDSLLGEGRRIWVFVNSDFHNEKSGDFWSGEYDKTYMHVNGSKNQKAILEGMKSGNVFVVHGDLIDNLYFTATADDRNTATMGGELTASPGSDISVVIKFKSPSVNNNGDEPKVDHVDLIAGDVNMKYAPADSGYLSGTNETAKVIARFTERDWIKSSGYIVIRTCMKGLSKNKYIRLRGTNLAVNTPGETDAGGNPLVDPIDTAGTDVEASTQRAYADMWFYSNPVFLTVE
ncbi:MAG: hypothetical protein KA015_01955 [Spirochaetes bacterium]|nr:hypothetical protein [Spirochaetota bacterium]